MMSWLILFSGILNLFLGILVLVQNPRKKLNIDFLIFCFVTFTLISTDFLFRLTPTLLVLRTAYALAVLVPFTAVWWVWEMCETKVSQIQWWKKFLLFSSGVFFFVLPYIGGTVVQKINELTVLGYRGELGPLFSVYSFYILIITAYLLITLFGAIKKTDEKIKKIQIWLVISGIGLYGVSGTTFSLILPKFFGIFDYTLLDAPSLIFFVGFTAYSILRLHLFNIKVIATELFVVILWLFIAIRIFLSDNISEQVTNASLLGLTVVIGAFLIRSVIKEVQQRERIEKLAGELEEANRRQESLLHFIGHEIKGYFTKSHWALSSMIDGDYGEIAPDLKALTSQALDDTKQGIDMVDGILKAGNFKKGTVSYNMKPFDFRGEVKNVIEMLKPNIDAKKLALETHIDETKDYTLNGDGEQISKHVLRNLIDNAIKYTPSGTITIGLSKKDGKILFSVKDSGVGIKEEDRKLLFTEGGRGKDSVRINVHSTGYGLFIAKQIVDAHHGRIWADSAGPNQGSIFFVEI